MSLILDLLQLEKIKAKMADLYADACYLKETSLNFKSNLNSEDIKERAKLPPSQERNKLLRGQLTKAKQKRLMELANKDIEKPFLEIKLVPI